MGIWSSTEWQFAWTSGQAYPGTATTLQRIQRIQRIGFHSCGELIIQFWSVLVGETAGAMERRRLADFLGNRLFRPAPLFPFLRLCGSCFAFPPPTSPIPRPQSHTPPRRTKAPPRPGSAMKSQLPCGKIFLRILPMWLCLHSSSHPNKPGKLFGGFQDPCSGFSRFSGIIFGKCAKFDGKLGRTPEKRLTQTGRNPEKPPKNPKVALRGANSQRAPQRADVRTSI